ncbi:hypothetical protein HX109_12845 [Galbibacter sp. BG1]|uniref:hypothetical protein n=1 Tax=Galbibacter sp. BG1 TaxID=1170699 RepID=UPI0015BABEE1|nr:hypothetical protein [Galbibacter sp. BG1]QLE02400.1 hypothetical protein HX109_12845 [Galbibacter sp. BG1]
MPHPELFQGDLKHPLYKTFVSYPGLHVRYSRSIGTPHPELFQGDLKHPLYKTLVYCSGLRVRYSRSIGKPHPENNDCKNRKFNRFSIKKRIKFFVKTGP